MQNSRPRSRERDPHSIRMQILEHLKEHGFVTHTRLSYVAELNSIYMERYMQEMTDAGLIRIIRMSDDNLKKYSMLRTTKRAVTITKKGSALLEMMKQMPIIDTRKRANLGKNGFK
jgi:predicted transcriptional regulator